MVGLEVGKLIQKKNTGSYVATSVERVFPMLVPM